jgi:AcrR family transcriptional regulator
MAEVTRTGKKPRRRTQEERRSSTRAALLDATIDCLIEYGYAATTTTRVVERAGVSRGAQVHHFPTKAELVSEAVRRLADRRLSALRGRVAALPEGAGRVPATLDLLSEMHSGPLFAASLELWVAARTDRDLRARMLPMELEVIALVREITAGVVPADTPESELDALVTTVITLTLGLGVRAELLQGKRAAEASWKEVRSQLRVLLEAAGRS